MDPAYVINAFPERREAVAFELERHGGADPAAIRWIGAPRGSAARGEPLFAWPRWREERTGALLTWGELACFAGHLEAWRRIAAGDAGGGFVFEDDAALTARLDGLPAEAFAGAGLVYLHSQWRCEPEPGPGPWCAAPYTWTLTAYWLSREAAAGLAAAVDPDRIVPADEYVPWHCGTWDPAFNPRVRGELGQQPPAGIAARCLRERPAGPSGRWESSTAAGLSPPAFDFETVVFATEPARAGEALGALRDLGYRPRVLGAGEPGWDASAEGGMPKLRWLREDLAGSDPRRRVVLALDGYDTLPLVPAAEFWARFAGMDCPAAISGERGLWPPRNEWVPDPERAWQAYWEDWPWRREGVAERYRHACSGAFAGHAETLDWVLQGLPPDGDDQAWMQAAVLANPRAWRVDSEAWLFQSLGGEEGAVERRDGAAFNAATGCYPAILHANGPQASLDPFLPGPPPAALELDPDAGRWLELAPGVLGMPFLSRAACAGLLERAEASDAWQPLEGDAVPGDELRLRALDPALRAWLDETLRAVVGPAVAARWHPAAWKDPCDAFLIRYRPDRQPSLRLHEDISYLSCSIRLRRACAGGQLRFPRQNFDDGAADDGWLLLWPSRITHPHRVLPVRRGTRASLVVWTPES